jgi:hypothetical protein
MFIYFLLNDVMQLNVLKVTKISDGKNRMQHDLQNDPKNHCLCPIEGFFPEIYIVKAAVIEATFQLSPKKFVIVIRNIPMPILFCGINWHGPSCKNLAMPKDDASNDRRSFIMKIDMNVDPL